MEMVLTVTDVAGHEAVHVLDLALSNLDAVMESLAELLRVLFIGEAIIHGLLHLAISTLEQRNGQQHILLEHLIRDIAHKQVHNEITGTLRVQLALDLVALQLPIVLVLQVLQIERVGSRLWTGSTH